MEPHAVKRHGIKRTLARSLVTRAEVEFFEPIPLVFTTGSGEIEHAVTFYPEMRDDERAPRHHAR